MDKRRTDLAAEARQLWQESAKETTQLEGVEAHERDLEGFQTEEIRILTDVGAQALGKPCGRYSTLYLDALLRRESDAFPRAVAAVSTLLQAMLPAKAEASALVIGLGNRAITPDAVGPIAVDHLLVTRHLREQLPEQFGAFRCVSALIPGVLGTTGVESGEIVRAMVRTVKPDVVIAIDALAGRSLNRLCRTVQLADTGITPGSGIGNRRLGLNEETLGVPVIAIGVPTVVEAATLAIDLLDTAGAAIPEELLSGQGTQLIVAPKDVDQSVADIGKVIGYGISLALQPQLDLPQLDLFLA